MSPVRLTDQIDIKQEPRGLYGRHLLRLEQDLADRSIAAEVRPLDDLWPLYEAAPQSWSGMPPMLDTRLAAIRPGEAACMVFRDRDGEVIAANAAKFIDLGDKTLAEACEDLTFFYGARAAERRSRDRCRITAPTAHRVRGRIAYPGGMWIEPSFRQTGLLDIILDLCRIYGPSQWACDHEFALGSARAFSRPEIQERYHFTTYEQALSFHRDGVPLFEHGMVCLSPIADFHAQMERRLDQVVSADRRCEEQRIATG